MDNSDKEIIKSHGETIAVLSIRIAALEELLVSKKLLSAEDLISEQKRLSALFNEKVKAALEQQKKQKSE